MEEVIKFELDFIISLLPTFVNILEIMRVVAIITSIIFIVGIVILLHMNKYLVYRYAETFSDLFRKKPYLGIRIKKEWKDIIKRAKDGDEEERKLAVVDADEVLDEVLTKMSFVGENLQEKLEKISEDIFPTAEEIKMVHQEKKDILYNPDRELSKKDAMRIIDVYEKTIRDCQFF